VKEKWRVVRRGVLADGRVCALMQRYVEIQPPTAQDRVPILLPSYRLVTDEAGERVEVARSRRRRKLVALVRP
jgi:hypothetical protein